MVQQKLIFHSFFHPLNDCWIGFWVTVIFLTSSTTASHQGHCNDILFFFCFLVVTSLIARSLYVACHLDLVQFVFPVPQNRNTFWQQIPLYMLLCKNNSLAIDFGFTHIHSWLVILWIFIPTSICHRVMYYPWSVWQTYLSEAWFHSC